MTIRYAVTFEFETQPPMTHRGTVTASSMPTCFARAAKAAVKAHPGRTWSSMVCVLLERVESGQPADAVDPIPASTGTPSTRA